jgi:hypothetical protein
MADQPSSSRSQSGWLRGDRVRVGLSWCLGRDEVCQPLTDVAICQVSNLESGGGGLDRLSEAPRENIQKMIHPTKGR